jgi:hypothetical protein
MCRRTLLHMEQVKFSQVIPNRGLGPLDLKFERPGTNACLT